MRVPHPVPDGRRGLLAGASPAADDRCTPLCGMPLRRSVRLVTVPAYRWQLQNPLGPLRHVNFRLLWTGELLRQSAQWMDVVTRGFLVLSLTGSAAQLALVNAVRGAPLLVLGLLSGVLADRVSRKRLLMASQTTNVVANVAVGVLA